MHNKKLFYIWMAFCAIVGIVVWSIAFWLLGTAVFAHENAQPLTSKIPSPPVTAGIEECFEKNRKQVIDGWKLHDRARAYDNVLVPCVLDADEDHQYKELIMQLMMQMGIKI